MFVSAVYQSDSVIHGFFVIFVPIMVYHRILNIVLYAGGGHQKAYQFAHNEVGEEINKKERQRI